MLISWSWIRTRVLIASDPIAGAGHITQQNPKTWVLAFSNTKQNNPRGRISSASTMASAISRHLRLRHTLSSLSSRLLSSGFHSLPEKSIQNSPLASLSPAIYAYNQHRLLRAFSTNHRFLCTNTSKPSVDQSSSSNVDATSPSRGSTEGNSGNTNDGGQDSGGSQDNSKQGKSVRGGVLFRPILCFNCYLLVCHILFPIFRSMIVSKQRNF